MTITEYCRKWNRDLDGNFVDACIRDNSTEELTAALQSGPDDEDCESWQLSHDEWTDAVNAAVVELRKSEL